MAIDPLDMMGASVLDQVDAALKGMVEDLTEADRGVVAVVRAAAMEWDKAVADGKALSAMNYLSYVSNGLEKLGGSVAARKALGKKADKPKTGLAAVRNLREVPASHAEEEPEPVDKPRQRTRRPPKSKGA